MPTGAARWTCAFLIAVVTLKVIWLGLQPSAEARDDLAVPTQEVILEISGKITRGNHSDGARFDRAMLDALGTTTLQTTTPWTDGVQEFKGVPVRDVLDLVGAEGEVVRAVAHNDYVIDIPIADFTKYPVLLALEMNGVQLELRDKGPIWIIYPIDHFSSLRDRLTERKMVWQLKELQVR